MTDNDLTNQLDDLFSDATFEPETEIEGEKTELLLEEAIGRLLKHLAKLAIYFAVNNLSAVLKPTALFVYYELQVRRRVEHALILS